MSETLLFALLLSMSAFLIVALLFLLILAHGRIKALERDQLTGAYRREEWKKKIEKWLQKQELHVCFIDINHLKEINDTYGHIHGDKVITLLASTLRTSLKERDLIGRYGGDEFVVAFKDVAEKDLPNILERIRFCFVERTETYFQSQFKDPAMEIGICIGFSCGVVKIPPGRRSIERIIEEADSKQYDDKNQQREALTVQ